MKTYCSWTQISSILRVWTAPGASETTPKGGALRAPPCGVIYWAPGIVQTPKIRRCLGPGKIGVHDYINTKLGLTDPKVANHHRSFVVSSGLPARGEVVDPGRRPKISDLLKKTLVAIKPRSKQYNLSYVFLSFPGQTWP